MRKLCKQHLALFLNILNIHRWKEKNIKWHNILHKGEMRQRGEMKIIKDDFWSLSLLQGSSLLIFRVWRGKTVLRRRQKGNKTRNRGLAFHEAAAYLVLYAGCTEDSYQKHLFPSLQIPPLCSSSLNWASDSLESSFKTHFLPLFLLSSLYLITYLLISHIYRTRSNLQNVLTTY